MISSPLKWQIIPQSQEYEHITQPWTFQLDGSNLHAYPNISELCQQTKNKSSHFPSSSPKALTKAPSVPKMAEHLPSFPWILSSCLQTPTWNSVPVSGTKEQVSARGTPAPYSPLEEGIFPPVMCAPRPVTHHSCRRVGQCSTNCQKVAPMAHPVAPRWEQAVARGARPRVHEQWYTGSISCLCFCSSPALPSLASRQAQLAAECLPGRLHTWHIPEQLQIPFPSIYRSFCALPGCCCIALGGLLKVFPQVFGD